MISSRGLGWGVDGISSILELDELPPPPPVIISISFLEPILRNLFSENRGLPLFFSSLTSVPQVRLSCDKDIVLLEAGSEIGSRAAAVVVVGSGRSETALRNFGLHEEALSRFSFSRTTGESDLKFAPGFRANRFEAVVGSSAVSPGAGGFGAILLLLFDSSTFSSEVVLDGGKFSHGIRPTVRSSTGCLLDVIRNGAVVVTCLAGGGARFAVCCVASRSVVAC